MFATYNLKNFPYIFVDFNRNLTNDRDFYSFTYEWINLYSYKKPFVLIFNTVPLENVSMKYCFYMSAFIKKIRNMPIQYLQKSYIIVKSKTIMNLLEIIFYLQPPVADVHICYDIINNNPETIEQELNNLKILQTITTKKPYLTFL
jgi:hypothetical protein